MLELVLIYEVLDEYISSHAARVAVLELDVWRAHNLVQPSNAHLVHTMDMPDGWCTPGGDYPRSSLVVMVESKGEVLSKDSLPEVKRRYAYRPQAEVTCHELGFDRAVADASLLLG